ncbi:MAG: DUF4394 domain-containing protein [Hyphomicrobiaceae bacterium]|nr:DUF4394 domain-containing protein [Hyphomicrobiaceae bacterium]
MTSTRTNVALWAATAVGLSALAPSAASAASLVALQDGTMLTMIDTDKKAVTGQVKVDGGAKLVGIDVRPSDGKLYGLAPDGTIVTIDAKTGKWEKKSQLSEKLPDGAKIAVDFNPVADRLRVVTSTGMSLRVNVEDGKAAVDGTLKYADADAMKGKTPMVTAVAYSNSVAGTKETAMYDIDMAAGTLVKQAPPNDGILTTIGSLGVKPDAVALDIASDGKGGNTAFVVAAGALHTLDLATGKITTAGPLSGLKGSVSDIAVLP